MTSIQEAFLVIFFHGILHLTHCVIEGGPQWFVLSINKTVTQSGTATNGESWRAVDGHIFPKPDTCSLTTAGTSLFLVIDFGRSVYVPMLTVHIDTSVQDEYHNVKLRIGDNRIHTSNVLVGTYTLDKFDYISNRQGEKGRYLSFDLAPSEPQSLSICEIFAYRFPLDSISLRKPAVVSSLPGLPAKQPGERMVDMHFASAAWSDVMKNPWIRLDLLDTYFVAEIIFVMYAWHEHESMHVTIGNSLNNEDESNPACLEGTTFLRGLSKAFPCRLKGQYVVITKRVGTYYISVAETIVNPSHAENIAEGVVVATPSGTEKTATDCLLDTKVVTSDVGTEHWLRVDLGSSLPVAKIFIVAINDASYNKDMIGFELRVGDSLTDNGNANPLCLPGTQSMLDKMTASFLCAPVRLTGRYVNVHQTIPGKRVSLAEIAVYSECPPEIKNREKSREIWRMEGTQLTLTCEAKGYPTPVISWLKDGVLLQNGPTTLQIGSSLIFNQSGAYECWANNTYGEKYKPVDVSITSDLRPCADNVEVSYDLNNKGTAYPAIKQKLLGHLWYRFSESFAKDYLQMAGKAPKKGSVCSGWITGSHPGISQGIMERNVCVKENNTKCSRQVTVRIRNCGAFNVYNFPPSQETTGFAYCFEPAKPSGVPGAAAMVGGPNKALMNYVFHRELEINDSTLCLLMCSLSKECQSFNFSRKKKICELNSSTKRKHPDSFVSRDGFSYYVIGKGLVSRYVGEL